MCAVFGSWMAATRRRCLSSLLLSIHEAVCLSSSSLPRAQVNWRESGRRRMLPSWLVRYGRIPTRFKMTRVGPWPNQASKLGASVVHGRTLALRGSSYYHVAVYRMETRYSYIINGQAISKRMYIIRWRVLKILQSNLIAQFLAVPFCMLTFSQKLSTHLRYIIVAPPWNIRVLQNWSLTPLCSMLRCIYECIVSRRIDPKQSCLYNYSLKYNRFDKRWLEMQCNISIFVAIGKT